MITTTINELKLYVMWPEFWDTLLSHLKINYGDDTPISIQSIIENNGIADALYILGRHSEHSKKLCLAYAADCAEHVLPIWVKIYPRDDRPVLAIHAVRDVVNCPAYALQSPQLTGDTSFVLSAALSAKKAAECAVEHSNFKAAKAALSATNAAYAAAYVSNVGNGATEAMVRASEAADDCQSESMWQRAHLLKLLEDAT